MHTEQLDGQPPIHQDDRDSQGDGDSDGKDNIDGDCIPDECFNDDDFGGSFPLSVEYDDDHSDPTDIDHDADGWF
jgi:hypothetical protein